MGNVEALRAAWPRGSGTLKVKLAQLNAPDGSGAGSSGFGCGPQSGVADRAHGAVHIGRGHGGFAREVGSAAGIEGGEERDLYLLELLSEVEVLQPHQLAVVRSLLLDLVDDPLSGVTRDVVDSALMLSRPPVSWPSAHGFGERVLATDLIAAGLS